MSEIEGSFDSNEVIGFDKRQKASSEGTMTLNEWNDLKRRSSMVRDFENTGPVKTQGDHKHKDSFLTVEIRPFDVVLWGGIVIGFILGFCVGVSL